MTSDPSCASIDVMQANKYGFNVAAHPCANGTCDAASQCDMNMKTDGIAKYGAGAYGPGGSLINTNNGFMVKTEFVSDADYVTLWALRTTLTQGGNEIMMEADCGDDYLNALTNTIEGEMGFIFSSWDNSAGTADFETTCSAAANCDSARTVVSNFAVTSYYSNEDRPVEPVDPVNPVDPVDPVDVLVEGGVADNVSMCAEGCTSCIETWMSDAPETISYKCVDETVYRYENQCSSSRDQSACGADDYCHWSWPQGDSRKARSSAAACRPIPDEFVNNTFDYSSKKCKRSTYGLCIYGCSGACHDSWFSTDPSKWNGASAMCRCM